MTTLDDTDWALREAIYAGLAQSGEVPDTQVLAGLTDDFWSLT